MINKINNNESQSENDSLWDTALVPPVEYPKWVFVQTREFLASSLFGDHITYNPTLSVHFPSSSFFHLNINEYTLVLVLTTDL
jgi:hypothetical protein